MRFFATLSSVFLLIGIATESCFGVSDVPPPSVVKNGPVLTINAENGQKVILTDYGSDQDGEQLGRPYKRYEFYKYFNETGHAFRFSNQEYEWGENLMVSLKTGTSFYIDGNGTMDPVLSPNHERFAIYSSNEPDETRYSRLEIPCVFGNLLTRAARLEDKVFIDVGWGLLWKDGGALAIQNSN